VEDVVKEESDQQWLDNLIMRGLMPPTAQSQSPREERTEGALFRVVRIRADVTDRLLGLLDQYPSAKEQLEWEHPYTPKKSALSRKNRDIYTRS
jgi:hypothetical protein